MTEVEYEAALKRLEKIMTADEDGSEEFESLMNAVIDYESGNVLPAE